MNKTLSITAITLVVVVMGMSVIVPMIQYAEASHGPLPEKACAALKSIPNPPDAVKRLIEERCESECPPDCGGSGLSVEIKIF